MRQPEPEPRRGARPPCTTMDCDALATHKALVPLDDRDEWFPYCWDCAETVSDEETPPVELIFTDEPNPFDPDELVRWAETYGHPEEWAKRAQNADARAERIETARLVAEDHCRAVTIERDQLLAERDQLRSAIEDYRLWEPGRAGHAEAHRKLCAALEAGTS